MTSMCCKIIIYPTWCLTKFIRYNCPNGTVYKIVWRAWELRFFSELTVGACRYSTQVGTARLALQRRGNDTDAEDTKRRQTGNQFKQLGAENRDLGRTTASWTKHSQDRCLAVGRRRRQSGQFASTVSYRAGAVGDAFQLYTARAAASPLMIERGACRQLPQPPADPCPWLHHYA